ncbi:unnamed protein product [Notodromas monacha]|uniref:Kynureninase n=1 Tax=Notodromas monacha TaxID=399045 RepID=A0A7R9GD78_9CRUS|nr:unnamed protein product [Notodromas monacha]CAG0916639.1 unnamed protein product [Notodromas monacha]
MADKEAEAIPLKPQIGSCENSTSTTTTPRGKRNSNKKQTSEFRTKKHKGKKTESILDERRKEDVLQIEDQLKAFDPMEPAVSEKLTRATNPYAYISPEPFISILADHFDVNVSSEEFAARLDGMDKLRSLKDEFVIPKKVDCARVDKENVGPDDPVVYLCSNLLGLKVKTVDNYMSELLRDWGNWGVWQNFEGRFAGMGIDQKPTRALMKLVGAREGEITLMNGCTVNLHFLMIHFYQPRVGRYKIICEENPFSSDLYCFKSQIRFHKLDPDKALIQVKPRQGERFLRNEDVIDAIEKHGKQTALVCFGGIQFFTGQRFDLEGVTKAAHAQGAVCGFDLAHMIGNCEMHLHRWNVDFAVWCSYKYLCGGQGAIGGAFVHRNHWDRSAPRLEGWWGVKEEKRFFMNPELDASLGANAFRISMASVWNTVPLYAAMEVFDRTCMRAIERKRFWLNGYFDALVAKLNQDVMDTFGLRGDKEGILTVPDPKVFKVLTPANPKERGNQITFIMRIPRADVIYTALTKAGFVLDYKKPNILRISPHMLYNTFHDMFLLANFLRKEVFNHLGTMATAYRSSQKISTG